MCLPRCLSLSRGSRASAVSTLWSGNSTISKPHGHSRHKIAEHELWRTELHRAQVCPLLIDIQVRLQAARRYAVVPWKPEKE